MIEEEADFFLAADEHVIELRCLLISVQVRELDWTRNEKVVHLLIVAASLRVEVDILVEADFHVLSWLKNIIIFDLSVHLE